MAAASTYQKRIASLRAFALTKGSQGESVFTNNAWKLFDIASRDQWHEFNKEVKRIRATLTKIRVPSRRKPARQ